MKLLVLNQKMDQNDPILGFFHEWVRRLSERVESLTVVCLEKGDCDLPSNVRVFSLGKESGRSRLKYLRNFYRLIWQRRNDYQIVFVHMNPEYVIWGGLIWRLLGKKIFFWYNHRQGGTRARIAFLFAQKIFYTSPLAFASRFKKARQMPAGIETEKFKPGDPKSRIPRLILSLGRISPVKRIDLLIEALDLLAADGVDFSARVYGEPPDRDRPYYEKIRRQFFYPSVPPQKTPAIYNQAEIFVNLTPSGSFDKTILEAMACATLIIAANQSLAKILPESFLYAGANPRHLADKIKTILNLREEEKEDYRRRFRDYAVKEHDLRLLADKLSRYFND